MKHLVMFILTVVAIVICIPLLPIIVPILICVGLVVVVDFIIKKLAEPEKK